MSSILLNISAGDEVIMPSFTFVSTANAFVLRGGTPVFVDIRRDTKNIDEKLIESAITPKTKAIVVVHYAGVSCDMDAIMEIARKNNIALIEDAAQGILSQYKGKYLGSFGDLSTLSFHETKNINCGEGGALLINNSSLTDRAFIIREKGTNRKIFYEGQVDKYSWVDIGSSFLPSDLSAAYLLAQLNHSTDITNRRLCIWNSYHDAFQNLETTGRAKRPVIPDDCQHNGHIYYLELNSKVERANFIKKMAAFGIQCPFHYVPLHSSPAGLRFGRFSGDLKITNELSERIVRLPLWVGVDKFQSYIIECVIKALQN